MIKIKIFNMKNFLKELNECIDTVNLLTPDNIIKNINKEYPVQKELFDKYKSNKNCISLSLDITNPKDYMKLVFYSITDC